MRTAPETRGPSVSGLSPSRDVIGVLDSPAAERNVEQWLRSEIHQPLRPLLKPDSRHDADSRQRRHLEGVPRLGANRYTAQQALGILWGSDVAVNRCPIADPPVCPGLRVPFLGLLSVVRA